MKTQDYNTADYEAFSFNEVNAMMQNKQLDILLEKNEEDPKTQRKPKAYIQYYLAKTFRPQNIQETIDDLYNLEEILTKDDTLVIVIKDEPNETIINYAKHIWEQDSIFVVIHNIKRLQYNILEHTLVPPHRILGEEEIAKIKIKYNIKDDSQLPDRSRFDPVSLALCLRPGQMCEVIRPSKTAISAKFYWVCV
jgi:DNA-directed RNA polymerase subunit H (RpoH/RPB5)